MPRKARMLLLDGEIEAAAGAVVGAQNQHHIFVADSAAQGFFVTHQCHGMDGVQTLYQTFRVVLALIQSHEANHAPQDAGAEGVGVALPATRQHGQGFFVEVCTVGLVFLKGRADADNLPLCAVVVQPQLQAGTFGGIEKSNGLGIFNDSFTLCGKVDSGGAGVDVDSSSGASSSDVLASGSGAATAGGVFCFGAGGFSGFGSLALQIAATSAGRSSGGARATDAISAAVGLTSPESTFCRVPGTASSAASTPFANCSARITVFRPIPFSEAILSQVRFSFWLLPFW